MNYIIKSNGSISIVPLYLILYIYVQLPCYCHKWHVEHEYWGEMKKRERKSCKRRNLSDTQSQISLCEKFEETHLLILIKNSAWINLFKSKVTWGGETFWDSWNTKTRINIGVAFCNPTHGHTILASGQRLRWWPSPTRPQDVRNCCTPTILSEQSAWIACTSVWDIVIQRLLLYYVLSTQLVTKISMEQIKIGRWSSELWKWL